MMGSERGVMLGHDVQIMLSSVADPVWDYVALGHIHKHQNLTAGRENVPPVVYSGSLERIDFGEEGDPKGFVIADVERGKATWELVEVESRPFLTLRVDVRSSPHPTDAVIQEIQRHDVTDTVARVIIQTDTETNSLLQTNLIERALLDAGASVVAAIHRDIEHPARSRLGPTPEGLTPQELLERYFQSKDVSPDRIEVLLDAAQTFFDEGETN
jgi:exonuclease SbcD